MALNGSLETTKYDGRYYQFNWTATNNVATNQSTVSWTLEALGGASSWYAERTLEVKINDSVEYTKTTRVERRKGIVASGTKIINHNSTGDATFNVSLRVAVYGTSVNCTGSTTFTLDNIPKKSTLNVSNGTLGVSQSITATKKLTSFTHTLTYKCGSYSGTIGSSQTTSSSWSFTPSLDFAKNSPNSTTVSCDFTLTTYNGGVSVGSDTKTVTMSIPTSIKPTCTLTLSDPKGYLSRFGGYIQNKSTLNVVVSGVGSYSSTIKTYSTNANSRTYTSSTFDTDVLKSPGTNTISASVTDSRNRVGTNSTTINVLPYSNPTISKFTVHRCDNDGTINQQGKKALITYSHNITSLNDNNDKIIQLKYKKTSESSWESTITLTSVYSSSNATYVLGSNPSFDLDDGSSYDIQIIVKDSFTTTTNKTSVSTAFTLMHFASSGRGLAIGKIAEKSDLLDVDFESCFRKGLTVGKETTIEGIFDVDLQANFTGGFYATRLNNGTDFNNLIIVGKYIVVGDNDMATMLNRPCGNAGSLYVMMAMQPSAKTIDNSYRYIVQIYLTWKGEVWTRSINSGATVTDIRYGEWKNISGSGNVQSDWNATSGDAVILNKPTSEQVRVITYGTGNPNNSDGKPNGSIYIKIGE